MKKFILFYFVFMIFLVGLNNVSGQSKQSYKESVDSVVTFVNKVGDVSKSIISTFFPLSDSLDLPYVYREYYDLFYAEYKHHEENCKDAFLNHVYNSYYSDVKKYYFQEGSALFNNTFEANVLGVKKPYSFDADPSAVEDLYLEGLSLGYSMDNPYLNNVNHKGFTCVCVH